MEIPIMRFEMVQRRHMAAFQGVLLKMQTLLGPTKLIFGWPFSGRTNEQAIFEMGIERFFSRGFYFKRNAKVNLRLEKFLTKDFANLSTRKDLVFFLPQMPYSKDDDLAPL